MLDLEMWLDDNAKIKQLYQMLKIDWLVKRALNETDNDLGYCLV